MGDEFTETKIRTYKPKVHTSESKFMKYIARPIEKFVSGNKHGNDKQRRLQA